MGKNYDNHDVTHCDKCNHERGDNEVFYECEDCGEYCCFDCLVTSEGYVCDGCAIERAMSTDEEAEA